ncbi:MAG: alpha/beta fold hydrolase [Paracoccaceae bacterium]
MLTFQTSDGLGLAYRDEGTGPAVLCLAGLTRDSNDFNEMASGFKGVRLIRLDSRGRGQSQWDPHWENYSAPREARDALELLDHLGIEKTAIIGTSRGGILAMIIAARAKHRLSAVLLNDVGPLIGKADIEGIVARLGVNPPWKTYEEAARLYPATCEGFFNVGAERWEIEVRRLFRETDNGLAIRYDPRLRDAVTAQPDNMTPDLWPLFDAFDGLPLALLRGENSGLLSPRTAAEMRRRRPDMQFAEVRDRAHIPFLDEPESLALIRDWAARLS